jgi:hypothetical protein
MYGFQRIVEERIREAMENGEFDDLDGRGKPLPPDQTMHVAPELRVAYTILKNNNLLPPEMETLKEIERIEQLLLAVTDDDEKYRYVRRINSLVTQFNLMRPTSVHLEKRQYYLQKLAHKLLKPTQG